MPTVLSSTTGRILARSDRGWDDARRAWNLAVDQDPAAVALPASVQDIVDHNAAPLGSLVSGSATLQDSKSR